MTALEKMEAATGAKTIFMEKIGSNTVWGFVAPNGTLAAAISDGEGKVVVNLESLRLILDRMGREWRGEE